MKPIPLSIILPVVLFIAFWLIVFSYLNREEIPTFIVATGAILFFVVFYEIFGRKKISDRKKGKTMSLMPGVQYEDLMNALCNAFDKESLEKLLRTRLNRRLDHLVKDGKIPDMVFELIGIAERQGWHRDLVREAYHFNPRNPDLAAIYEKYGYGVEVHLEQRGGKIEKAPTSTVSSGFERRVRDLIPMLDMAVWREKLAAVEGQVCRIEKNGRALGTGFLVGPDLVLTNYHVMEDFIKGNSFPKEAVCRFDYKSLADNSREEGRLVKLHATDWNVDSSRYSNAEANKTPDQALPDESELDYSLIRLADLIGNQPVGQNVSSEAPPRKWVEIVPPFPDFTPDLPLLIVQHPDGKPIKLAMDTQGVISENGNRTRVRYHVNTEGGSSGSPCFTLDWKLAALHHYGDPAYNHPKWNQGIPIGCIWKRIGPEGKGFLPE